MNIMNLAFHDNNLSYRGTTVSMYDYANKYENFLYGQSFILYNRNGNANNAQAIADFNTRFQGRVFGYSSWSEVDPWLEANKIDKLYMQKGGDWDGKISTVVPTLVHAVFPNNLTPHGEVFAFISEWLSKEVESRSGVKYPYVPYMVSLPHSADIKNFRKELGIRPTDLVFGQYGGEGCFGTQELSWVRHLVCEIAKTRPDIHFIFMNPDRFGEGIPNIHFLPINTCKYNKVKFIQTCDAMLHARHNGESFGAAIAEFAYSGVPVISWRGGGDQNHTFMLKHGIFYNDYTDLKDILLNRDAINIPIGNIIKDVEYCSPIRVMRMFCSIFGV